MKSLHPDLARILRVFGVTELNDVQQVASKSGLFTKTEDYALLSQSRTGKSFAGTLLLANEMFKKITNEPEAPVLSIIVAPFHASARETSALISKLFGWFLRPLVLVGEIRQTEIFLRLSKGLAPNVIIATPDALQDILRVDTGREWLLSRTIVTVIFDDVHSILHDPTRGSILLELSDFFRTVVIPKPRVLLLSAVFNEPERLEKLFKVKLIHDTTKYQPPEFRLIKYSSTAVKKQQLHETLESLAEQGHRSLVYMKMISIIEETLEAIGDELTDLISYDLDPLVRARLEKIGRVLKELEYPHADCIMRGIGFYHGQLEDEHRWFVEWAFRRKHLRMLFGTEALAYGVNTPVSDVVMESPGIDEIFRQSMMARAVQLRRGRGKPGTCTVFTKTIEDSKSLNRVYFEPQLPLRFLSDNNISRLFLGMIGLGLMSNESDRKQISDRLGLIFKKGSTTKVLNGLMKSDHIFIERTSKGKLLLTSLGMATFHSGLSAEQVRIILDGLSLIEAGGGAPTEFDLLLLINSASVLDRVQGKTTKDLDDRLQSFLTSSVKSVMLPQILDTDLEKKWRIPIEYSSLILACMKEDINFEPAVRKSTRRLLVEVRMFTPNFTSFLEELKRERALGEERNKYTSIDVILSLLDRKEICDTLFGSEKVSGSFRGKDLSFVNFGDIESSIDATLTSSLAPLQKIQLLDLLDSVEMTTSAFVDLLAISRDDPEANAALETVLSFCKEGRMGSNLIRALEEEGLVERGTIDGLLNSFSKRVDEVQKRTDAPAKAAKVLLSLFSGDLVGLTTSGISALKIVLGHTRGKVDTSTL